MSESSRDRLLLIEVKSAQVGARSAQAGACRDKWLLRRNNSGVSRREVGAKS